MDMDTLDTMDTMDTHTDMDTLASVLLMLSQRLMLTPTFSMEDMDMDILDMLGTMDTPMVDMLTGDRLLGDRTTNVFFFSDNIFSAWTQFNIFLAGNKEKQNKDKTKEPPMSSSSVTIF